jgi:hypothetical protein
MRPAPRTRGYVDTLVVGVMLVASVVAVPACAERLPPPPPPAPTPREAASPAVGARPPEAAPKPLTDPAVIGALLHDAYRRRAQGAAEEARTAFERVAELARAHAPADRRRADDFGGVVPARGGYAAVHGERGMLFFQAETGEPVAFEPEATLDEQDGDVLPEGPFFLLRVATEQVLYDALAGAPVVRGPRIHVAPGTGLAYAFETSDCRWHAWDLRSRREAQALEARGGTCQGGEHHEASFITPDGRWLVGLGGRWDLRTRRLRRFPEGSAYGPSMGHAVSSDRRFVAYFRRRWPLSPDAWSERVMLALLDLRSGTETRVTDPAFSSLSNGNALEFADAPLRLLVVDYTMWAYAVPSLRLLVRGPPAPDAPVALHPLRPEQEQALLTHAPPEPATPVYDPGPAERLRAHACDIGGFPLPIAVCGDGGATAP